MNIDEDMDPAETPAVQAVPDLNEQIVDKEIENYKHEHPLPIPRINAETGKIEYNNPLVWWNARQALYPTLSALARRVLNKPTTSAPSERLFTGVGLTIANERTNISPDNAESTIFIHDNNEIVRPWLAEHMAWLAEHHIVE